MHALLLTSVVCFLTRRISMEDQSAVSGVNSCTCPRSSRRLKSVSAKRRLQMDSACLNYHPSVTYYGPRSDQTVRLPHGCWGQVLHLDYARHMRGVKYITLGFDFEFNPVCIVEDSAREDDLRVDNANGPTDWSALFPDYFNWTEICEGKSLCPDDHSGVWFLEGHRLYGLDVIISSEPSNAVGVLVEICRVQRGAFWVWEFSIGDLGHVFANPSHKFRRELGLLTSFTNTS